MFDYPLPVPHYTLYEEFGLEPEATADEIRGAMNDRRQELRAQQSKIGEELNPIYTEVPDLKGLEEEVSVLRLENPNVKPEEREAQLRAARERLDAAEHQALGNNSEFRRLRERREELKREEEELNTLAFSSETKRLAYDREHPPLELFKLAKCERNDLFDRGRGNIALTILRRELSVFLAAQGEVIFHPSDLTREDFSSDFTYIALLDGAQND